MDNKVTKKRIARHLEYDWYKYLIIIALSIALCWYGFYMLNGTRTYEKLDVFISCYKSNEGTLGADFHDTIRNEGDDWMREINISVGDYASNSYYETQQVGLTGDILILPKSYMDGSCYDYVWLTPEILDYIFTPLQNETDDYDFTAFRNDPNNFYTYTYNEEEGRKMQFADGRVYGIRVDQLLKMQSDSAPFVFDYEKLNIEKPEDEDAENAENGEDGEDVEDTKNLETEFYMVFTQSCIKMGKYGADVNHHDLNQAFRFARYFIGKYNQ